jgi:hypothetical protein
VTFTFCTTVCLRLQLERFIELYKCPYLQIGQDKMYYTLEHVVGSPILWNYWAELNFRYKSVLRQMEDMGMTLATH